MRFTVTRDVERFAELTEDFLARALERNVMATVLSNVRRDPRAFGEPLLAYALDAKEEVCAAALRTPPWPLLVGDLPDSAAEPLMGAWLEADADVAAVNGPAESSRAVASAWRHRTGGSSRCRISEAMHILDRVREPERHPPGTLRLATPADVDLLGTWEEAFSLEAGVGVGGAARRTVQARLERGGQFVWDDGSPHSMLGVSPSIAGIVRIGPVYTPPEYRGRGYASSAVACAARDALQDGAHRCMLFTDLANPTSNKIYAAVGFRRMADWEEHELLAS